MISVGRPRIPRLAMKGGRKDVGSVLASEMRSEATVQPKQSHVACKYFHMVPGDPFPAHNIVAKFNM
jgi:hypothetical protein